MDDAENSPLTKLNNALWAMTIKTPDTPDAFLLFICVIALMRSGYICAESHTSIKSFVDLLLPVFKSLPMCVSQRITVRFSVKLDLLSKQENVAATLMNSHRFLYLASSVIEFFNYKAKNDNPTVGVLRECTLCASTDKFFTNMKTLYSILEKHRLLNNEDDALFKEEVLLPLAEKRYAVGKDVSSTCLLLKRVAIEAIAKEYGAKLNVHHSDGDVSNHYSLALPSSTGTGECAHTLFNQLMVIAVVPVEKVTTQPLFLYLIDGDRFSDSLDNLFKKSMANLVTRIRDLRVDYFTDLYSKELRNYKEDAIIKMYQSALFKVRSFGICYHCLLTECVADYAMFLTFLGRIGCRGRIQPHSR